MSTCRSNLLFVNQEVMRGKSVASNESLSSPGLRVNSNSPSRNSTKIRVGFFDSKTLTQGRSARHKAKERNINLRNNSSSIVGLESQTSLHLQVGNTQKQKWKGRSPSISIIKEQLKVNRQSMVVVSRKAHPKQSKSHYNTIEENRQVAVAISAAPESQRDYGLPPAKELETVWQVFNDDSARRRQVHPLVLSIKAQPIFADIAVLVLENKGIERIFDYLKGCRRLIALYLKGNRLITRDLVQIQHLQSLRRVDLSANSIHFLPDSSKLAKLAKLEYLSLHDNQIVGWRQLENMVSLKQLHYLTLIDNPCSKIRGYRHYLIESMPHLRCLDNFIVMDFEREEISKLYPSESLDSERLKEFNRFRPFNRERNYWETKPYEVPPHPLPRVLLKSVAGASSTDGRVVATESETDDELTVWHRDYHMTTLQDRVSEHLYKDSYDLRRKFEYSSPVVTIQKTGRMYNKRKLYLRKRAHTRLLLWAFNRQNLRGHLEHAMAKMNLTRQMLFQIGKVRLIQKHYRVYKKKVYLQLKYARRAQSIYRMRRVQMETLAYPFQLDLYDQGPSQKKILFAKSQLPLLDRMGISELFDAQRQSKEFALRRNPDIKRVDHAQSPLMNTIIGIYRFVRVLRAQSFFTQIVHEMNKTKRRKVLKLTQDGQGNSKVLIIDPQQNDRDSVGQKMSKQMQLPPYFGRSKKFKPPGTTSQLTTLRSNRQSIDSVLDKPLIDDGTALVEVSFRTDEEIYDCIRLIQFYNWQQETCILFFYEPFLRKFEAALRLQRFFKGWIFRRRQKTLFVQRKDGSFVLDARRADREISAENTVYAHFILVQRVSRVIQKAYRAWRLRHRLGCLAAIAHYAKNITTNELFLDQNLYLNLHRIFDQATGAPWKHSSAQAGSDSATTSGQMRNNTSYWEQTQSLFERRFRFEINMKDCKARIQFSKRADQTGRYLQSNFPLWFQRIADTEVPKIMKEPTIHDRNRRKQNIRFTNSIMSLLHAHPYPQAEKFPFITTVGNVVGPSVNSEIADKRLLKIAFQSVPEAKNRAILLALLTCNVRKNELCFLRMFSAQELKQDAHLVLDYHTCMQQSVYLPRRDKEQQLASVPVMQAQHHHGVVKKREDPYATLLRARPKQARNQFTRFIVLGDATATAVKERLGDAFISNEVIDRLRSGHGSSTQSVVRLKHDSDYNFTKRQLDGKQAKVIKNFDASVLNEDQSSHKIPVQKKPSRNSLQKASKTFMYGSDQWKINGMEVQRGSQLSPCKRHINLRNQNLSPNQMAMQKRKLSHNKNQLLLLERLNTKLEQLKLKVEDHSQNLPVFKSIFLDQLIQIWKANSRQPSVAISHSPQDSTCSAYIVDIPKRDYNYLDPRVEAMEPERLQDQIRELHKEYSKHKDAYRKALQIARLTSKAEVTFLDEDSAQASDITPMTPRTPAIGDRRRSHSSRSGISAPQPAQKVTFMDQNPQLRDPEVRNSYMCEAIALVGPAPEHPQSTQLRSIKSSTLPGLPADSRPMATMPTEIRINQTESYNVDLPSFNQENMVQQLFRVGDSKSQLAQARAQNEQRLIQQSQSMHELHNQNMVIKASKFMRVSKEKELVSFTQNFVNQANRLINYEVKQLHSDIKTKSRYKQRQSSLEQRQKSKMSIKSRMDSNLKLDIKVNSSGNKKVAETLDHSRWSFFANNSPGLGQSKLKRESSYIRPESNQQRIRVQAKFIPGLGSQSSRIPVKTSLIENEQVSRSQIIETLKPSIADISSHQSVSQQTQLEPRPSLPVINQIPIPEVQRAASNQQAMTDRSFAKSKNILALTKGLSEYSQETKASNLIRQKTDAVLLDIDKMQRAREIQAFQEQQSNQTSRLRLIKKKISPSRSLQQTSLLMEPRKSLQKAKIQNMMMEQQLTAKKGFKRLVVDGTSAKNQLPGSTMPKNSSVNTIETIMRNRQHKIDEKQSLLKDHGLLQTEEQMSHYMADDYDVSMDASVIEEADAEQRNPQKRSMSPFNYRVNDLVLPRSTMVGVSRSKYINQFVKNDRRRMLSFLPSLKKQYSIAKMQHLQ